MTDELKKLIMGVCIVLFMLVTALTITSCDGLEWTPQAQPEISHHRTPSRQERILMQQGYTNIRMTGTPLFSCSEDDSMLASSSFTATAPSGDDVDGSVCCGLMFKGCTVRFE